MNLWRWSKWLPDVPPDKRLDLGAGSTPLVRSRRIGPAEGLEQLYFKLENANPTASYKDRFAAVAISHMLASGQTRCVATSSGNAGAAMAAHCAAAGIKCEVALIVTAPSGKVNQMLVYGADLYRVEQFGRDKNITRDTFERLRQRGARPGSAMQITAYCYSPIGMEGVKTISYEVAEQLEPPAEHVFIPVCGGGLALAVARGFVDLVDDRALVQSPRIECVQPMGNDTVAGSLRTDSDKATPIAKSTTEISGLQCPSILDGDELVDAAKRSGGTGHLVSDDAIYTMQNRLAREEGIFSEPAGAVAAAGAVEARRNGLISADAVVVCLVTGSGFKDPVSVDRMLAGQDVPQVTLEQLAAEDAGENPKP